jgi:hypothetical protein
MRTPNDANSAGAWPHAEAGRRIQNCLCFPYASARTYTCCNQPQKRRELPFQHASAYVLFLSIMQVHTYFHRLVLQVTYVFPPADVISGAGQRIGAGRGRGNANDTPTYFFCVEDMTFSPFFGTSCSSVGWFSRRLSRRSCI